MSAATMLKWLKRSLVMGVSADGTTPITLQLNPDGTVPVTGGAGGGTIGDVTIHDPTVTTQKLGINASGQIAISNFPAAGLTDTQLRATPVPVSGTLGSTGLTDTQLRATPVPVSAASLPLPAGAALEAGNLAEIALDTDNLALIKAKTDNLPADPAREGGILAEIALDTDNLATIAAKDFATQATLALIKAKTDNLPADPAREGGVLATAAKQDTAQTSLASINTQVSRLPVPVSGASSGIPYGVLILCPVLATTPNLIDGQLAGPSITPDGRIRVNLDEESYDWKTNGETNSWHDDAFDFGGETAFG